MKRGLVNEFRVIDPPIVLPCWGHLVDQFLSINHQPSFWDFMLSDRDSSYKKLPIRPIDSRFCYIALFGPFRKCRCAFGPKTQISGPTASALRYNVFSRILPSIINRIFGIPILGYVDDYGPPIPTYLGSAALQAIRDFCSILGVDLKKIKRIAIHINSFLGLLGSFTTQEMACRYRFS